MRHPLLKKSTRVEHAAMLIAGQKPTGFEVSHHIRDSSQCRRRIMRDLAIWCADQFGAREQREGDLETCGSYSAKLGFSCIFGPWLACDVDVKPRSVEVGVSGRIQKGQMKVAAVLCRFPADERSHQQGQFAM